MAPGLVAVEIAPPDAAPPLKQALLDACTRAAGERCAEPQGEQEPNVVAIVSWVDPQHARVEVALRREQRWVVRAMGFGAGDAPPERWRAVGLVIGTLASLIAHNKEPPPQEAAPAPAPQPEGPPERPPPPLEAPKATPAPPPSPSAPELAPEPDHAVVEPPPAPRSAVPSRRGFVGAALVVGSALDRGGPRLGGELDGHLLLGWDVYALAGAAYSASLARVGGVETTFAEAFLGISYARDLGGSFTSVFHAEGVAELFSPSIEDGRGGPTSGERWLGGARFGADVYFWGTNPVGFFAGASAKWTAGVTDVVADGAYVGSTPTLGYVVRAGASFGFR